MTADDINQTIARAGQATGTAVAAALAGLKQDDARVRQIVREELAAHATELGHDGIQAVVGDARPPLKPLDPVLQGDGVDGGGSDPLRHQLVQAQEAIDLFAALITIITTNGAQGQEALQDCLARNHRVGDLVEPGAEHASGVVGGHHETSPSLGAAVDEVSE